jgi:hypothetical protein
MTKCPRPGGFKDPLYMPSDAILRALGRVAAVSAGIEDQLHALYWELLKVRDDVGRIITGDMRASRMTEDILKLARASNRSPAIIEDLIDLFADLREKNQRRNQVLHWIWDSQTVGLRKAERHCVTLIWRRLSSLGWFLVVVLRKRLKV